LCHQFFIDLIPIFLNPFPVVIEKDQPQWAALMGIVLTFLCRLLFSAAPLLAETPASEPDVPFYENWKFQFDLDFANSF